MRIYVYDFIRIFQDYFSDAEENGYIFNMTPLHFVDITSLVQPLLNNYITKKRAVITYPRIGWINLC